MELISAFRRAVLTFWGCCEDRNRPLKKRNILWCNLSYRSFRFLKMSSVGVVGFVGVESVGVDEYGLI